MHGIRRAKQDAQNLKIDRIRCTTNVYRTRLIYYGVETMYFVVFVVKSALKVIPSIIIFTR